MTLETFAVRDDHRFRARHAAGSTGALRNSAERPLRRARAGRGARRTPSVAHHLGRVCDVLRAGFRRVQVHDRVRQHRRRSTSGARDVQPRPGGRTACKAATRRRCSGARSELGVGHGASAGSHHRDVRRPAAVRRYPGQLLGGSTLELTRMEVGRFINQHSVLLDPDERPDPLRDGWRRRRAGAERRCCTWAPHGDYTVWIDGDVDARAGLRRRGARHRRRRRHGHRHRWRHDRVEIDSRARCSGRSTCRWTLLANADFGQHDQGWQALDVPNSRARRERHALVGHRAADDDAARRCGSCASRSRASTARPG